MLRTSPFRWRSARTVSGASIGPSAGPWTAPMIRKLTASSTSRPRLRRLSSTALLRSLGLMGPVEVAGVDVVDAARDRLAQHRDRGIVVLRRPEHARPGELHGPVAKTLHNPVTERKRSRGADVVHKLISSWTGHEYRQVR